MTLIILNGANGKMGKSVINAVEKNNEKFKIVAGVDFSPPKFNVYDFKIEKNFPKNCKADAIIDFSNPNALEDLLQFSKTEKIPLVIATTGYTEDQIKKIEEASKTVAIFFTFNMSLGINLLIELVKKSNKVLKTDFDIEIVEKHHNQKIDAPSGTAIMIADAINNQNNDYYEYIYDRQKVRQKRQKNEIGIHSIRAGTIIGEHEVIFSGEDEIISISHTALSKNVFAIGAIKAAEFIKTKDKGLYNMKDLVSETIF